MRNDESWIAIGFKMFLLIVFICFLVWVIPQLFKPYTPTKQPDSIAEISGAIVKDGLSDFDIQEICIPNGYEIQGAFTIYNGEISGAYGSKLHNSNTVFLVLERDQNTYVAPLRLAGNGEC